MKASKKGGTSRRKFLKLAGLAATGSTCVNETSAAARPPHSRIHGEQGFNDYHPWSRDEDYPSTQTGGLALHPPLTGGLNGFKSVKDRRIPGWLPDTATSDNPQAPTADNDGRLHYFQEEAIGRVGQDAHADIDPFPGGNWDIFADPTGAAGGNPWVLGGEFPEPDHNQTMDAQLAFKQYLWELANKVRYYNAALYWTRRVHFFAVTGQYSRGPKRNPNGLDADTPQRLISASRPVTDQDIADAEYKWEKAVTRLYEALRQGYTVDGTKYFVWADMIEVNRYIVSMRIVSSNKIVINAKGGVNLLEVVGSYSSHISISSALKSP